MCPFCATVVADGRPPVPGTCPDCQARFVGDADSASGAVDDGLSALGVDDLGPADVVNALFVVPPDRCRELGVAIVSDDRQGFYRWWLFIARGRRARDRLDDLVAESRK